MNNTEQIFPQNLQIQGILDQYLNSRSAAVNSQVSQDSHLDEDFLSAFIEGKLNRRESAATLNHLVNCSFCRHITAKLIELDFSFADNTARFTTAKETEPAKISDVLSGILSRLFGSNDAAVFAHEEKTEEETENSEDNKKQPE